MGTQAFALTNFDVYTHGIEYLLDESSYIAFQPPVDKMSFKVY